MQRRLSLGYVNVQAKCCCKVSAAQLKFEAFIKEAILFQRHLAGFWRINFSPGNEGTGGGGGGRGGGLFQFE